MRKALLTGQQRHGLPRGVQPLPKVPRERVRYAQVGLGDYLYVEGATAGGQGEGMLASHNGAIVLAHDREADAQVAGNPSEPLVIPQPLGESLGSVQVAENACVCIEWQQDITQVVSQIDGLLDGVTALGEPRQGGQRLLEGPRSLAIGRLCHWIRQ